MLHMAFSYKVKILRTTACFPFAKLLNSYLYTREYSTSPLVKQHVLHRLENPTWILAEQGQGLVLAGY